MPVMIQVVRVTQWQFFKFNIMMITGMPVDSEQDVDDSDSDVGVSGY